MILTAEGTREAAIKQAEGKSSRRSWPPGLKQAAILAAKEADRQSRMLRARGEAPQLLQARGEAKAIEKTFAAIKAGRPTPEMLACNTCRRCRRWRVGTSNKVWVVPSDTTPHCRVHQAAEPGRVRTRVFSFEPSPVEDQPNTRPTVTTPRSPASFS